MRYVTRLRRKRGVARRRVFGDNTAVAQAMYIAQGLRPTESLRRYPNPSCAACPGGALLRAAPAGCHGALGAPPAPPEPLPSPS
jgi:hypothetical protein